MNEKQKHELRVLAENLERVPSRWFTMHFWGDGNPNDASLEEDACAYAGCAIGWAPMLIPNCGLILVKDRDLEDRRSVLPTYEGRVGMESVCLYFGITFREAVYLFDPTSYSDDCDFTEDGEDIKREAVSARIIEFLRLKECEPEEDSSPSAARLEELPCIF